jgi:uncharacterized protein YggE
MTTASIAVRGSASDDFPADFALLHIGHFFVAPARSEALAAGNAVVAQLRALAAPTEAGVRELKVRSLRVEETFKFVGPDNTHEPSGWSVQLVVQMAVVPFSVSSMVAGLIKLGVSVNHVSWHLDRASEIAAFRAVRRLAVADAATAASDFVDALGATLGSLVTLSDPGLLHDPSLAHGAHLATRSAGAFNASATSAAWDAHVDIDPDVLTVSAQVEASYEINLAE